MQHTSTVAVPVSTETFLALYEFLKGAGADLDPVEAVERSIDYWIDNAAWKPELSERRAASRAYRWKEVSLPDGTEVRMKYRGEYHHARIDGDTFVARGKRSSPSQFARAVTNTSRNAWRDLEVKRPHDRAWVLAANLRGAR